MHTAYLKLLDGRATFDGRSEFRAFLFGVIRRTARDERRRRLLHRIRVQVVVGVEEDHEVAAARREAGVQRSRLPAIALLQHRHDAFAERADDIG